MADSKGMNSFILDPEVVAEIQDDPLTTVETFEILDGCEDADRSYDVPTGQTFSNGVVLYYTPVEDPPPPPPPKKGKSQGRKRRAEEEADEQPKSHRGLGVLDILPVSPQIIFTHGGGRGIFQRGYMHFMHGLARTHAVLAFRKDRGDSASRTEELHKRTAAFHYFYNDAYGSVAALGGRSVGARSAVHASVYSANRSLILWSYPLIRDSEWRKDELIALSEDTRVLFIKGERDWMAPGLLIDSVRKQMKAKTWMIQVKEMDHNFKCNSEIEEEKISNALGVIAGVWLRGDDTKDRKNPTPWDPADGTEMKMEYDAKAKKAVWTNWSTPARGAKKQGVTVQLSAADDSTQFSFQVPGLSMSP